MSEEENRVYFSKKDITFYGDTEKEKKINEQLFDASLLIAQKDDEIKELNNIINELDNYIDKKIEIDKKLLNPKKGVKPYGEEKNYFEISLNRLFEVKNKLKELKENKQ